MLPVSVPRGAARHAALTALWSTTRVTAWVRRPLNHPRVHFLYFHQLPHREETAFVRLLEWLGRDHRFVAYSQAFQRVRSGKHDVPEVAFSLDDGFRSGLRAAAVLERVGARACFFVCPSLVGVRDVGALKGFFRQSAEAVEPLLTWGDLENLVGRGHEIGSHTMLHSELAAVPEAQLEDEIGRSRDVLTSRLGHIAHFAWPYGRFRNFSAPAADAVFRAGYASCASAVRGCHTAPAPADRRRLCLRREHIMPGWPLHHVEYLLGRSVARAGNHDNDWPAEWPIGDAA